MIKNKIAGVKPFNSFFFRSCYYHQLLAGLASFEIDLDMIILNSFVFIDEGFSAEDRDLWGERKLARAIGYKNKKCNLNRKKLVRFIDSGSPIIVGVDCYYLESRPDTYLKKNCAHFILVYGYDLEKGTLNIIDHNYINSGEYMEKEVSMENVLLANRMFHVGIYKRKYTCRRLKKVKKKKEFHLHRLINKNNLKSNQNLSLKNLDELKRLCVSDLQRLEQQADKIVEYLKTLKGFYFSLSKRRVFLKDNRMSVKVTEVVNGYSNILSLLWKMRAQGDYTYATKKQDSILRKIDEIQQAEKEVYDFLLEVENERISND